MKALLTIMTTFVLAVLPSVGWSSRNPQIRQCHQVGGEFVVIQTSNDQIGLCRLRSAYIGALDLLSFLAKESTPLSVELYAKAILSCDPLGTSKTVRTLEGKELRVCFYADGSVIEVSTLQNGIYSSKNSKLNEALGL